MNQEISFDTDYIEKLRNDVERVKEEEISIESFLDTLKKVIPNTIKNFLGFSKSVDVKKSNLYTLDSKDLRDLKNITNQKYLDITDSICYIPPHYTGTYIQYCELLDKFSLYSSNLIKNMSYFEENIGIIISTKNGSLKDFSKDVKVYNQWKVEREELKKELAALFTSKSTSDKTSYSQVIRRQSDWFDIDKSLSTIAKRVNDIDSKKIKDNIKILSDHLVEIKAMLEKGEIDNSNKSIVNLLSVGCLEIAEQIEFYALLRFQYDILFTAVTDTIQLLNKK